MENLIKDEEISTDEKLSAVNKATAIMLEYMGSQKTFQTKLDKGIHYLQWMLGIGLFITVCYIGTEMWNFYNPPASQVTLEHIQKENADLANRQKLFLDAREVFLEEKKAFVKEKEIFASERITFDSTRDAFGKEMEKRRRDIVIMQTNVLKQDSINKSRVKTVNAKTINTEHLNIKINKQ